MRRAQVLASQNPQWAWHRVVPIDQAVLLENRSLKGKTLFITGASRGIGLCIALRAARDGANVVIAAKTDKENPKLPGTIFTAAKEIEAAGGKALAVKVDVRDEQSVQQAVDMAVKTFGGIDILVNNASAISLTPTDKTEMKRYDLMHQVNTRGTFLCTKLCLPHLKKAKNPHVLNLSPPLNMDARWFGPHVASKSQGIMPHLMANLRKDSVSPATAASTKAALTERRHAAEKA
jgi:NAD(P)-dependent dehydrogenase (short-subunit alcohol dehydrogenase family)